MKYLVAPVSKYTTVLPNNLPVTRLKYEKKTAWQVFFKFLIQQAKANKNQF